MLWSKLFPSHSNIPQALPEVPAGILNSDKLVYCMLVFFAIMWLFTCFAREEWCLKKIVTDTKFIRVKCQTHCVGT